MSNTLTARISDPIDSLHPPADNPQDADAAFKEYCQTRLVRQTRVTFAAVGALNLLCWPVDWIVFAPTLPEHIPFLIRTRALITILTASFLVFSSVRRWHRWIFHGFFVFANLCCFTAAAGAARVGGPDVPNFYTLYVSILTSVPLPLVLSRRTILTATMGLSMALGLFVLTPQHLESKFAGMSMSFLVAVFFVSAWFGDSLFRLLRDNFMQATQLRAHGRVLESRVAARTAELRRLLTQLETAREAERRHIARELHDELGQELSALRYSLGLTKIRYGADARNIASNLEDLENLVQRTAQTTRALVTDLRPRAIDDLGLGAAVEWLVDRTRQRSDLTCRLTTSGDLRAIPESVAMTVYRLLQEALTNVLRHAEATEVDIDVQVSDSSVFIEVRDDGVGMQATRDKPHREPSSGVGILGMRERVNALGGDWEIGDVDAGRGTVIRCRLPLDSSSRYEEKRLGGDV